MLRGATAPLLEPPGPPLGVEVGAGGGAEAAGDGRAQVGEDVAEQVVGDDHVEAARVGDQVQAGGVGVGVVEGDPGL
jgi:hypothetical protein